MIDGVILFAGLLIIAGAILAALYVMLRDAPPPKQRYRRGLITGVPLAPYERGHDDDCDKHNEKKNN